MRVLCTLHNSCQLHSVMFMAKQVLTARTSCKPRWGSDFSACHLQAAVLAHAGHAAHELAGELDPYNAV